ncbi:MAG TPA: FtsX-like permease family protein [Candidatus Limnocylindrales bacterium]|nr:FtsX-like permease family protein [Candidatus Limnocylindrales bacterium]
MSAAGALLRVSRRDVRRSPWRSLLVGLLILLPVMGMAWGITILATVLPSADARDTHQMGAADLLVQAGSSEARRNALFPPGTRLEPMMESGGRLLLPGTSANVSVTARDLDGLARGSLTIADGRQPTVPGEAAISASLATVTGASIGGQIQLEDIGTLRVVGIVEDPWDLSGRLVLLVATTARGMPDAEVAWLVALPPGADPMPIFLAAGDPAQADDPIGMSWRQASGPLAELSGTAGSNGPPTPAVMVLGGLVLLESALVAAAAFAVSIRRRQRELGLLAATGGEPRHLAGTVLGEGLVLGVLGAAGGVAAGLIAAALTSPFLPDLTNQRTPPPVLEPVALGAAALIGLIAALVAASVPAWAASRMPVLLALSGRRPPSAPARRYLRLGLAVVALAALMTFGGATLSLTSDDNTVPMLLLAGGAMLGTLGFGAISPWLLERLEGVSARMPVSGRIALRDTARARSRSAPIVTAILASLAATIAIGAYATSRDAEIAARYEPWMAPDQIIIEGPDAAQAGPAAALAVHAIASSVVPGSMVEDDSGGARYARIEAPGAHLADPNDVPRGAPPSWGVGYTGYNVSIADAPLLRALHAEAAAADLDAGVVVLLTQRAWAGLDHVSVIISDGETDSPGVELPARAVMTGIGGGGNLPEVLISASTAAHLGLSPSEPYRYVLRLDHAVTDADLQAAAAASAPFPDTRADADRGPGNPDAALRVFLVIASLLFAVTVTGIAVSLGEIESRPDQRTLLALGAEPRLRRRITAARAGVLAILAGCLAVPAGLLPVWGLLESRGSHMLIPVPEIAAAVAVLPLLAIGATWLLARPIPDWSAFRSPSG